MTVDEELLLLHAAIGQGTMAWSVVELELARVASACGSTNRDQVLLIQGFFAVENFRSKLVYVEALLKSKFGKGKLLDSWPKLKKRIERAAALRNKIAHWHFDREDTRPSGRRVALVPSQTFLGVLADNATERLYVMNVVDASYTFNELSDEVGAYFKAIGGTPVTHPRNTRKRTLQDFRDEVRGALENHPNSNAR